MRPGFSFAHRDLNGKRDLRFSSAKMDWTRTVFRLRALPEEVNTDEDAARYLSARLDDVSWRDIWVYSIAATLRYWEDPPTKVATIMFSTAPSLIQRAPNKDEWIVPTMGHDRTSRDLILDIHFNGLTPLQNPSHIQITYDCVAISGLASHPFGSWQPRGGDKRFMWIRDELARSERGSRIIIYGYDTKLDNSNSFQNIPDLAKQLIDQLHGHRHPESDTPLVFLAHSLGGLVLKQALRDLADNHQDEEYQSLMNAVCGAVFFGVPNHGMEQDEFEAIVDNNPNRALIQDLSRRSNFILQLNIAFKKLLLHDHWKFFWAYELKASPTTIRQEDGTLTRNGNEIILVSPESATCGFSKTNRSVTFSIHATHSDMVKFGYDSHYYAIVRTKLKQILRYSSNKTAREEASEIVDEFEPANDGRDPQNSCEVSSSGEKNQNSQEDIPWPPPRSIAAELNEFKRRANLTPEDEDMLINTTLDIVQDKVGEIQMTHEMERNMIYIARLGPFLSSMDYFGKLADEIKLFPEGSKSAEYIWGPLKYILDVTWTHSKEFDAILNAYLKVGDKIPGFEYQRSFFVEQPHLREVLVMIYKDILSFQAEIIRHLKLRQWDQLFHSWLRNFEPNIDEIAERTGRNKRLIENRVSFLEIETLRKEDLASMHDLKQKSEALAKAHQDTVNDWLSAVDFKDEHHLHQEKRRICNDPGRWLLCDPNLRAWESPDNPLSPSLWLNGIPGAGKTILASIVVDRLLQAQNAIVAYFHCKYGDEKRNSMESITRSILAQVLDQNPDLLPYLHEKAHMNVSLASSAVAAQILSMALRSCERVFLVIDGLDECGRPARKNIAATILRMVNEAPEVGSIRCLFVSQEDDAAAEYFLDIPSIKIGRRNLDDILKFAGAWQETIQTKFGANWSTSNIQAVISKKAEGMFIFADLFAKYLGSQLSMKDLEEQLRPGNLPVELDDLYDRILHRIYEFRDAETTKRIKETLGWVVCAHRPLRWEEIQALICITPEDWGFDDRKRLVDSPGKLFASLVDYHGGTVHLVHGTARKYLTKAISKNGVEKVPVVRLHAVQFSLAVRCLTYLTLPAFDPDRSKENVKSDLLAGMHQLYDYASACWALHLLESISHITGDDISHLHAALEKLVDLYGSQSYKPLRDVKKVHNMLIPFEVLIQSESKKHENMVQAVAWANKQSGRPATGPSDNEALKLWKVTEKIRAALENVAPRSKELETVKHLYGENRFKCSWVNCYYYYQGFRQSKKRDRHLKKHTRPYLCFVSGCPMEVFGYAVEKDLQKHLFNAHHIDESSDKEDNVFPDPRKGKASNSREGGGMFKCPDCNTTFTQKKSLNRHLKNHLDNQTTFPCDECDRTFKRKEDRERHQSTHGEKNYVCAGLLSDGTKWGCNKTFSRKDKLKEHFQPDKGFNCILPLIQERQQAGGGNGKYLDDNVFADLKGYNSKVLLIAGRSLPPFRVFLEKCGLDASESGAGGQGSVR